MPAPELTPAHVHQYTGVTVVAVDIEDAAEQIALRTGVTVADHVDTRSIPETSVRRAWAIVAARLREQTAVGGEGITSESQGDYSYTRDGTTADRAADLLHGLPRRLLNVPHAEFAALGDGANRHPFWTDLPLHDPLGSRQDLSYLMG
jgi:hypothetical protein